jgi:5-methylcytosine-specific restriction endonuclease McrA
MRDYKCNVYKQARLQCLARDKRCKMPGCKSKKKLVCHHIIRWADAASLRYELNNLITLCKTCHDSIKNQESHYVSLFQELIRGC